jgi:hypothetical protein
MHRLTSEHDHASAVVANAIFRQDQLSQPTPPTTITSSANATTNSASTANATITAATATSTITTITTPADIQPHHRLRQRRYTLVAHTIIR